MSSSSGCSSDGGASFTTGLQKQHYAPSEYHVGPRRPLCEKLTEEDSVSEGANSSGRNTPIDSREDEETDSTMPTQVPSVITGQTGSTGVSTFTPFTITPQGPSMTQPSMPHILMVHGSSSGNHSVARSRGQSESRKTNSVDHTHQSVLYPCSVESVGQSVVQQPMSVDSSTHVSYYCVEGGGREVGREGEGEREGGMMGEGGGEREGGIEGLRGGVGQEAHVHHG